MNAQEALEILNRGYAWQYNHPEEWFNAKRLFEQLVNRATPIKPTFEISFGVTHHRCPICDSCVEFVDDNPGVVPNQNFKHKFCPNCGQAIDESKIIKHSKSR